MARRVNAAAIAMAATMVVGCGKGGKAGNEERLAAMQKAEQAFEASRAAAAQRQNACLAPVAAALAKLPAETWTAEGTVPPTDRAAMAGAIGVSFDPTTGTAGTYATGWLAARKLGATAACEIHIPILADVMVTTPDPASIAAAATKLDAATPAPAPGDVVVVNAGRCEQTDTGYKYEGPNTSTSIKGLRCDAALVWIRLSTGTVLAKVTAKADAGPGGLPETATEVEVREIAGHAGSEAYDKISTGLSTAIAAWSPEDAAIAKKIEDEARAQRLRGLNVSDECAKNPLAKGCN